MPTESAPLMLSISGMRGLIGRSLLPARVADFAACFGNWLASPAGRRPGADPQAAPLVVVGRDSRPSGPMVEAAAVSGLLASGCRVILLGIQSTPAIAVMLQHLQADGGLAITASHNPTPWNGLKPLRHDGVAPPKTDVEKIIADFQAGRAQFVPVDRLQPVSADDRGAAIHVEKVLPLVDAAAIRAAHLKVVVDSVHGAGGPEARLLLAALGVEVVHLYGEPTGHFPHTPEPTRENLTGLCAAVTEHGADAGFAQDPDADRLAIVDEQGTYIGEEYTLALCAKYLLKPGEAVAANLSTSRMIDDLAAAVGGRVLRSAVGEANVAGAMREHGALIGGEGNGGIIHRQVSQVRDSLVGMAVVLAMLAERKLRLSQIVAEIPRYAILKDKVELGAAIPTDLDVRLTRHFPEAAIDRQDGIRLDWPDRWVHVRASNTEPILRLIAEAGSEAAAADLLAATRSALGL